MSTLKALQASAKAYRQQIRLAQLRVDRARDALTMGLARSSQTRLDREIARLQEIEAALAEFESDYGPVLSDPATIRVYRSIDNALDKIRAGLADPAMTPAMAGLLCKNIARMFEEIGTKVEAGGVRV